MHTDRIRVYIAGPLSSSGDRKQNVRLAMAAARLLIEAGYAPLCPHLSDYLDATDAYGHDTWLAVDLPWVAVSQAVLRLSGPSKGADMECELAESLGIPVVSSIRELDSIPFEVSAPKPQPSGGDPRFLQILRDMAELHCRKSSDYGTDADPFANIRRARTAGVEPWRAAWVRSLDKIQRIECYCQRGSLANESLEDSLLDLAAYALITLIMHREEKQPCPSSRPHNAPAKAPTSSARAAMAPV